MVLLLFDGNDVGTAHPECIVTHVRNFLFFSNHSCRTCLSIILLPSPFGEGSGVRLLLVSLLVVSLNYLVFFLHPDSGCRNSSR